MVGEALVALLIKAIRRGEAEGGDIVLDHVTKPFTQAGNLVYDKVFCVIGGTDIIDISDSGTLEWVATEVVTNTVTVIIDGVTQINTEAFPVSIGVTLAVKFNASLKITVVNGGAGANSYLVYRLD